MIAIEISTPGNAEVLKACTREIPSPSEHQVLIQVAAAGVNRPDIMQRKGLYPAPEGASDLPGLEVAGTVIEIGSKVQTIRVGDRICALLNGGGYAEYSLASESLCLPLPAGFDFVQAASLPETFFTVWSNVFDRAHLKPRESFLVHGGSGGIGSSAIQLAKAFGAKVFTTAGSDEKCRYCTQLGADQAINYKQQDFVESISDLTEGKGVDVILDMIGGDYFPRNLKALAVEGRLIQIAIQNGAKCEINLWSVMQKRLTISGSTLRNRNDNFKAKIAKQLLENVWPLLENGSIKPVVSNTFPLSQAVAAHQLIERGLHKGKIILTV